MTRHEAGNALWEAAVLCGRLEDGGMIDTGDGLMDHRGARLRLHVARGNAILAGVAGSDVEHSTRLGLEWGRQEAEEEHDDPSSLP